MKLTILILILLTTTLVPVAPESRAAMDFDIVASVEIEGESSPVRLILWLHSRADDEVAPAPVSIRVVHHAAMTVLRFTLNGVLGILQEED